MLVSNGTESLLKLNFHSCSFRVISNLLSKTATVGDSMTSAGNPFHRLATQMVRKFCLSPFSCVGRLVELHCC